MGVACDHRALAAGVMLALAASGARPVVVRIGLAIATIDLGATITIDLAGGGSRKFLSTASLLLTLLAIGAIARRISIHREISTLTVLGAVCLYVLLGLSFAFAFESRRRVRTATTSTPPGAGTRSDYVYFSFTTLATVGYGDLTAQDGVGRALAVTGLSDLPGHHRRGPRRQPRSHECAPTRDEGRAIGGR